MDNSKDVQNESRRTIIKLGLSALATGVSGLAFADAQKIAQTSVMYQTTPNNGQACEQCIQFVAPNACKVVAGTISPKGYCVAFAPKPK